MNHLAFGAPLEHLVTEVARPVIHNNLLLATDDGPVKAVGRHAIACETH